MSDADLQALHRKWFLAPDDEVAARAYLDGLLRTGTTASEFLFAREAKNFDKAFGEFYEGFVKLHRESSARMRGSPTPRTNGYCDYCGYMVMPGEPCDCSRAGYQSPPLVPPYGGNEDGRPCL